MLTRIAAAIVATCALMASASAWAQDDAETKAEEQRINAAELRMVDCLKRFPALEDGAWDAVEAQVRRRIAVCGKDYLTLLEQGGETAEASGDLAFYVPFRSSDVALQISIWTSSIIPLRASARPHARKSVSFRPGPSGGW